MSVRLCVLLSAFLVLWFPSPGADRKVSLADCRYSLDPEAFLNRAVRERRTVLARSHAFQTSAAPGAGARAPARPAADVPRRNFIDDEIFARLADAGIASAPASSDEEFFRRINLDLTGRIPSPDEVRAFLADTGPARRDQAVDRLLASPEFVDRWTLWMGDLLQNTSRLVNAAVNRNPQGRNAFHAYIRDAVTQDKSLRTIATEVVTGAGNSFDTEAGAANFPLGASTSMGPVQDTYDTMLVRTASTFLGLGHYDCLLCHNGRGHLSQISAWGVQQTRAQALSMAAFFSRMVFTPAPGNSTTISDATSGGYGLNTDAGNRPPREPIAGAAVLTPAYRGSEAEPQSGNWRAAFAGNLVQDPMFARNLANRLWKQMFGLALADPVDGLDPIRLDPANPPPDPWTFQASHPNLLAKLAAELAQDDFRLRPFLRTLVFSSAYQLGSRSDAGGQPEREPLYSRHYPRRLDAEEVHDAIARATGVPGAYTIPGWPAPVAWAIQLPEPVEPASNAAVNLFLNDFFRGNRDTQERSQSGSIQQQLHLMNNPVVTNRIRVANSPRLRQIAQIAGDGDLLDELYLTFLSRRPTARESASGVSYLAAAGAGDARNSAVEDLAWMCINKVEFLYSY